MSKELMDDDIRYLRKWLNEENTSPVDRVALATVLNEVINLRDRMGGSEGLHRINAHKIKFLKNQLVVSQAQIKVLREALEQCREAFEFTRQYVGYESLPAIEGWSWFDADTKAKEALSTPHDDSALRELLKAERERCAKVCEKSDRYRGDYFAAKIRAMEDQ